MYSSHNITHMDLSTWVCIHTQTRFGWCHVRFVIIKPIFHFERAKWKFNFVKMLNYIMSSSVPHAHLWYFPSISFHSLSQNIRHNQSVVSTVYTYSTYIHSCSIILGVGTGLGCYSNFPICKGNEYICNENVTILFPIKIYIHMYHWLNGTMRLIIIVRVLCGGRVERMWVW